MKELDLQEKYLITGIIGLIRFPNNLAEFVMYNAIKGHARSIS